MKKTETRIRREAKIPLLLELANLTMYLDKGIKDGSLTETQIYELELEIKEKRSVMDELDGVKEEQKKAEFDQELYFELRSRLKREVDIAHEMGISLSTLSRNKRLSGIKKNTKKLVGP